MEGSLCPVCYTEPIEDPVSFFQCAHQMCRACSARWILRVAKDNHKRATCPECRREVALDKLPLDLRKRPTALSDPTQPRPWRAEELTSIVFDRARNQWWIYGTVPYVWDPLEDAFFLQRGRRWHRVDVDAHASERYIPIEGYPPSLALQRELGARPWSAITPEEHESITGFIERTISRPLVEGRRGSSSNAYDVKAASLRVGAGAPPA